MSDTVKIQRPIFSRRARDVGGRVVHDPRGNAFLARTRASDSEKPKVDPALSIVDEELGPDPLGPDLLHMRRLRSTVRGAAKSSAKTAAKIPAKPTAKKKR